MFWFNKRVKRPENIKTDNTILDPRYEDEGRSFWEEAEMDAWLGYVSKKKKFIENLKKIPIKLAKGRHSIRINVKIKPPEELPIHRRRFFEEIRQKASGINIKAALILPKRRLDANR